MSEWISINDRLPIAGQITLIYRPDAPMSQDPAYRIAAFNGEKFACYIQPSHWQPLPEPPAQ